MDKKIENSEYFREKLNAFLDFTGISRKKISETIDVNYQQLTKVLSGHTKTIDAVLISKLVNKLDLNPIWFFTDEGPKRLSDIGKHDNEEGLIKIINELQTNQKIIMKWMNHVKELIPELKKDLQELEDTVDESKKMIKGSMKQ